MYLQTLAFFAAGLLLLSLSRLGLVLWQWSRAKAHPLWPIFVGGWRIDACILAILSTWSFLFAIFFDASSTAQSINTVVLTLAWILILLPEVSSAQFIIEYDTRPNRLFVDYLKHPEEVLGMLWKGYKLMVFAGLIVLIVLVVLAYQLFSVVSTTILPEFWLWRGLILLLTAVLLFGMIRGTLKHRPINPSTVAYCGDSMLNTLPLNSLYNVAYAVYSMKNERSASAAYGKMDEQKVVQLVNQAAAIEAQPEAGIVSLHTQQAVKSYKRPKNIVLLVQESLGAQYIGTLGGQNLSPEIDKLYQKGWGFERCYATGTRSVRGLEAVSSGFPPTISDAVLRLNKSQSRFFTLAQLLKTMNYQSSFIYGGEAHFDNMKSFFLGNGFSELYDIASFTNPAFVGTWGASDEDMFNRLHDVLMERPDVPKLSLAFTVTNHTPWEYPAGRIESVGEPASVENSVRYVDWCVGRFFERAMASPYWEDTLFVMVADHDSRVWGQTLVPVRHFHIPALILGGSVPVKRDTRIISQIDLPVTLLSLAGISAQHPMIGFDLNNPQLGSRAMMQYNDNYGYLQEDILTVLRPNLAPEQLHYVAPEQYSALAQMRPDLIELARAHAIWPSMMYQAGAYSLPSLLKSNT